MTTKTAAVEYQTEIRFGVVMYGGVSLAVYINGVSHELFEMACATPLPGVTIGPEGASASREIYDRLSWLAGNPTLVDFYAQRLSNANPAVDPWDEASRRLPTGHLCFGRHVHAPPSGLRPSLSGAAPDRNDRGNPVATPRDAR